MRPFSILIIALGLSVLIFSCSTRTAESTKNKEESPEEKIVTAFNCRGYDFVLSYSNDNYTLQPSHVIDKSSLQEILDNKTWEIIDIGHVTTEGFVYEEGQVDGAPYSAITFNGNKVHVLTIPDEPFIEPIVSDRNVSYEDNTISIDTLPTMNVCGIDENNVFYFERTAYKNYWMYYRLERKPKAVSE